MFLPLLFASNWPTSSSSSPPPDFSLPPLSSFSFVSSLDLSALCALSCFCPFLCLSLLAHAYMSVQKICHCKRTSCLKGYCDCFHAGRTCTPRCGCQVGRVPCCICLCVMWTTPKDRLAGCQAHLPFSSLNC